MNFSSTIFLENSSGPITNTVQTTVATNVNQVLYVNIHVRRPESVTDYANSILTEGAPILTREQYSEKFGASDLDLSLVCQFAEHYNLTVLGTYKDSAKVQLSGTVSSFNEAFKITINDYTDDVETYRSFSGTLSVPTELSGVITGVMGLDDYGKNKLIRSISEKLDPAEVDAGNIPAADTLPGATYLTPQQVSAAYNYPVSPQGYSYNGYGRTIGLLQFDGGWTQTNLDSSFGDIGLPNPTVKDVLLLGQTNDPTETASAEVMLDIFVAAGMAPKANIVVYFAPNVVSNYIDAFDYIIADTTNNPDVISISWCYIELGWQVFYSSIINTMNDRLATCATLGITVVAATGDWGAQGGNYGGAYPATIPMLASNPYVLAAGGTSLVLHANNVIQNEVAWNHDGSGTGGGTSVLWNLPSYQSGLTVKYFPVGNTASLTVRGIPDIAGNADSATGYRFYYGDTNSYVQVGGTSATAPQVAAFIAIINQLCGRRLGFTHPLFYANQLSFNDITTGNNGYYATNTALPAYYATTGWDACTGLGSIRGNAIYQLVRTGEVYPKLNFGSRTTGQVYPRPVRRQFGLYKITPTGANVTVTYLVIGGGGGGGGNAGGGGGGGGFRTGTININGLYTVVVGSGGSGAPGGAGVGSNGSNSGFWNVSTSLWSTGGGYGGSRDSSPARGATGGSGGGGGGGYAPLNGGVGGTGGAATPGQGFSGGQGRDTPSTPAPLGATAGGGGGGAGATGTSAPGSINTYAGNGGIGLTSSLSGTPTYYSGGGGAGIEKAPNIFGGIGGAGGGGLGGSPSPAPTQNTSNGTINTGGGGGGGGLCQLTPGATSTRFGGGGGSGIIIFQYSNSLQNAIVTGATYANTGGYRTYTFTNSGTITI
jgi:kumamolisin